VSVDIIAVGSAIFAINMIENNEDDFKCQADDYWVKEFYRLGFYGDYVQDLM
jgi:hypothetical protein